MNITEELGQLVERRREDRRRPIAVLSRADADAQLRALQYTGSVLVEYACGVPKEYNVLGARILLDKIIRDVDS